MRRFKDRDFIEDLDGFLYCVIGYLHPPNRVLAYLKYVPSKSKNTIWYRNEIGFVRVLKQYSSVKVIEAMKLLEVKKPHYIYYDNFFNIKFLGVPKKEIKKHYMPELKLEKIVENGPKDILEHELIELVNYLVEISNVEPSYFGVSGSILVGIHNPKYSDIDLMIYGRRNSLNLINAINENIGKSKTISLPDKEVLLSWAQEVSAIHPLTLEEAMKLYVEKKMRLVFKHRRIFSIHPAKLDSEILDKYGEKIYQPLSLIKIRGKVTDDSESLFLPATYFVDNVKVLDGNVPGEITEITTFEGLYSNLLTVGEEFIAYGKVEKVTNLRTSETYYRLVIGSAEAKGKDYIKPLRWFK